MAIIDTCTYTHEEAVDDVKPLKSRAIVYFGAQNQIIDKYRAIIDRKQINCVFGHAQNQLWGSVYRNNKQIRYDVVSLPFLSYVIREL